jgi:hypothetical protein
MREVGQVSSVQFPASKPETMRPEIPMTTAIKATVLDTPPITYGVS